MPSPAAGFPYAFHNQLINIIMLKKTISYETPDMRVFEMHIEGVMCESPQAQDNYYGLRHISGDNVNEESDYWM